MKKILLFIVAFLACSYNAFSQQAHFTEQTPNVNNTRLTASIVCSEAATVVFEVVTSQQNTSRACIAGYRVNNGTYMYEHLPVGTPSSRKTMVKDLPQGKSPVELTADNAGAVLIILTVNGVPVSTPPLTLYNR